MCQITLRPVLLLKTGNDIMLRHICDVILILISSKRKAKVSYDQAMQ